MAEVDFMAMLQQLMQVMQQQQGGQGQQRGQQQGRGRWQGQGQPRGTWQGQQRGLASAPGGQQGEGQNMMAALQQFLKTYKPEGGDKGNTSSGMPENVGMGESSGIGPPGALPGGGMGSYVPPTNVTPGVQPTQTAGLPASGYRSVDGGNGGDWWSQGSGAGGGGGMGGYGDSSGLGPSASSAVSASQGMGNYWAPPTTSNMGEWREK